MGQDVGLAGPGSLLLCDLSTPNQAFLGLSFPIYQMGVVSGPSGSM